MSFLPKLRAFIARTGKEPYLIQEAAPCPFCGGSRIELMLYPKFRDGRPVCASCMDCEAEGPVVMMAHGTNEPFYAKGAAAAWNRRGDFTPGKK